MAPPPRTPPVPPPILQRGLYSLFAEIVERQPNAVAVTGAEGESLTYLDLARRSEALAGELRARQVGPESAVAVRMERSPDLIIALLAIVRAEGAYVPIDPSFPDERQAFLFEDSGSILLIRDGTGDVAWCPPGRTMTVDAVPFPGTSPLPPAADRPEGLAYIMYTSGSTGVPKGVMVRQRGVVRLVRETDYVELGPSDAVAQVSTVSFDAATFEIWGALLNGARLVLIPKDVVLDPPAFGRALARESITTMFLTAALFNQISRESPAIFGGLRTLLVGGEALDGPSLRRVLAAGPPGRLLNGYGPTEVTTFSLWHHITAVLEDAVTVPIGRPIANTTAQVLDPHGRPVAPGTAGELWLGGPGVAAGYRNRPELTAERFVNGLYRTGDKVRENGDGDLEYLGRLDDQIKLRGYRIEPGEIERTLEQHPAVSQAVVALRTDGEGEPRLVAYVTSTPGRDATPRELLDYLAGRLPAFMVPAAAVPLAAFPLNANGKLDRGSLPEPARMHARGVVAPQTEVQRRIAAIWSDLLGVDSVGLDDDFIRLGGHSLLAIRIVSRIRQELQVELPFTAIFEYGDLGRLAAEVERIQQAPGAARRTPSIHPVSRARFRARRPGGWEPHALLDLLDHGDPGRTALESEDRAPLSYGEWARHAASAAAWLRAAGLGPGDAAAVVLPNGPGMATAFLATATAGISAPLNPAYRRDELDFYLGDLNARMLLISRGVDSPARMVARERGIRVVEVGLPEGAPSGVISLDGEVPAPGERIASRSPDATALVLHTSGTTSRPKIVPLSQANLLASAQAVARTLELGPGDRCLNVMPLFHIHGLVAAVLGSLAGGGSVICTPGFLAPQFFGWLSKHAPTWYTAVPTMHQAILARASERVNIALLRDSKLRFARSSSAALPRKVMEELETALGVPVIEAYGMTEAAHQMASNPLPPRVRKAGTVGQAAGPEIALLDATGQEVPRGQTGEVAIRGPNVTAGYASNPEANAGAFTGGWLRTGDEGVLDQEGYLTLTGRLKEQINRAGEKISPLEVDQVLTDHPSVASALSFAVAHPILGEDIAAVVILKPGAAVTERQLREYVSIRLAYFKVPRRILRVDTIPTGPTGKLQRIGLAERLGVRAEVPVDDLDATPPRTPVEEIVATSWSEVMGAAMPGVRRNFFALGGDSILAARLIARLREQLAVDIPLLAFFDTPSVEGLGATIDALLAAEPAT